MLILAANALDDADFLNGFISFNKNNPAYIAGTEAKNESKYTSNASLIIIVPPIPLPYSYM